MRIAGIDASTNKTGIAIFVDGKYETHTLIDLHKIKDPDVRIPNMMVSICDYLDEHKVDRVIMEESILKTNIDTVKKLSNLAGAVMYYTAVNGIEFELALPSVWRKRIGLTQGKTVKRETLKAEAILVVKQEYDMDITDDECEAILMARSGFDLPKIVITEDDVWEI
jgi:Holliday junction resolvasome RuvABC endonuclease subunit